LNLCKGCILTNIIFDKEKLFDFKLKINYNIQIDTSVVIL